jgi:putative membrane protein
MADSERPAQPRAKDASVPEAQTPEAHVPEVPVPESSPPASTPHTAVDDLSSTDSHLTRTHPATVVTKTARSLVQMIFFLFVFVFFRSAGDGGVAVASFVGVVLLFTLASSLLSWLAWSRFTYGIVGNDLLIVEGILVRKRRTIPLARIQGVNVRADLVMRALGLAELRVQTAGGGDEPEAKIGSIPLADAEVLRAALLRGHKTAEESAGTTAENPIFGADPAGRMSDFRGALGGAEVVREQATFEYALSIGRLALAAVTSKQITIMLLIAMGFSGQIAEFAGPQFFEDAATAASMVAIPVLVFAIVAALLIGLAIAVVVAVVRTWGFVARRVDRRIETEAGLLERRMTSLPVGRVQTVSIDETWIRRLLGYQSVYVETAGFGRRDEDRGGLSKAAIVPLAKRDEIEPLMNGLLPEAQAFPPVTALPRRSLRFYVFAPTLAVFLIVLPIIVMQLFYLPVGAIVVGGIAVPVAAVVAGTRVLNWRAAGVGTDAVAMTVRTGVIGHRWVRIGRSRIQSLHVKQNPFQRRAGLATLTASTISASSEAKRSVSHIPLEDAERIVAWFHEGIGAATRPA